MAKRILTMTVDLEPAANANPVCSLTVDEGPIPKKLGYIYGLGIGLIRDSSEITAHKLLKKYGQSAVDEFRLGVEGGLKGIGQKGMEIKRSE